MPILGIWASQISGHLWAPEGAYDALATVSLSTTTASVTFSGIPSGYKHLQLRLIARTNRSASVDPMTLTFNNDTSGVYSVGESGSGIIYEPLVITSTLGVSFKQIDNTALHAAIKNKVGPDQLKDIKKRIALQTTRRSLSRRYRCSVCGWCQVRRRQTAMVFAALQSIDTGR